MDPPPAEPWLQAFEGPGVRGSKLIRIWILGSRTLGSLGDERCLKLQAVRYAAIDSEHVLQRRRSSETQGFCPIIQWADGPLILFLFSHFM